MRAVATGVHLAVPQFLAEVVGIISAKDAGHSRVIGVAVQNTIGPDNAGSRCAAVRRERQLCAGHAWTGRRAGGSRSGDGKRSRIKRRTVELESPAVIFLAPDID